VLHVAGADLDFADLGGACSLRVNAAEHKLTVRHGHDHRVCASGPRGLIYAERELDALRIGYRPRGLGSGARASSLDPVVLAQVIRHSDGQARWLELRFAPEAIMQKVLKNKGNRVSGIGSGVSGRTPRKIRNQQS